jgi:transcription elongation factor GreA
MNYKHIKQYFPSNKHFYLTKDGLDGLRAKLDHLRKQRFAICNQLMKMDSKEKIDFILTNDIIKILQINEEDVMKIADVLQHAELVKPDANPMDVRLGSTVNLQAGDQTFQYTLVSTIEADPSENKISENSPLGQALIGRKRRETISLTTPKGQKQQYKVLSIA